MFLNRKRLLRCGLVVMTGPLSFMALAQSGYVDLEAEAAAREVAGDNSAPADPYGIQPARTYPAGSYGVSAPVVSGPSTTQGTGYPATGAAPVGGAPAGAGASGNLGSLVLQIQQLQREVMRLNGQVEEQAHELRTLKEQSLQRYMDLDKRLSSGAVAASNPAGETPAVTPPVATTSGGAGGSEQPGEKSAYDGAYGLVVGRQFERAIPAFQQFLRDFPDGKYAPNAHYWLGELYLVLDPPDLEPSRQAFALLISQYPDHAKVPDALFKLGKVQYMKGNREKAREYLDLVVAQYSASHTTVAKLAEDFIAENY